MLKFNSKFQFYVQWSQKFFYMDHINTTVYGAKDELGYTYDKDQSKLLNMAYSFVENFLDFLLIIRYFIHSFFLNSYGIVIFPRIYLLHIIILFLDYPADWDQCWL